MVAHLLITRVDHQRPVALLRQRTPTPQPDLLVELLRTPRNLRRAHRTAAQLLQNLAHFAGRDPLDVHLLHRHHDGPVRALPALIHLRRETALANLRNLEMQLANRRVHRAWLVAITLPLATLRTLVGKRCQMPGDFFLQHIGNQRLEQTPQGSRIYEQPLTDFLVTL